MPPLSISLFLFFKMRSMSKIGENNQLRLNERKFFINLFSKKMCGVIEINWSSVPIT